jgi:NADPH-dependent glutamate synthase beta subunit-like oxidoreductase/ferredoxin
MSKQEQVTVEEVICPESGKIYLAPCQVRCPLKLNIQRSHTAISQLSNNPSDQQLIKIGDEIFDKSPLFPIICGNICGLCEEECNYKDETGAIRRRKIIWPLAKVYLKYLNKKPKFPNPTKEKVAIIGGGPGGISCAFDLSKKGYKATIFDRNPELGGALRYIPKYRLPTEILNSLINNIIRIANIDVKTGVLIGKDGESLEEIKNKGYKAIFMATGTPNPRGIPLQEKNPEVEEVLQKLNKGDDSHGIKYGLNLLYEVDRGDLPLDLYKGKKVIVVGGGNVAFDVARTARRLGGKVTLMCLECEDKSCKDGIPADVEEIEGAEEEGIKIIYSRGVYGIELKKGNFKKLKTVVCKSVFTEDGRFSPEFDTCKIDKIKGDVLLITIGQGPDRDIYKEEGLLNDKGRLDIDPITLMSNRKKGIFIGGDVKQIGFASEAMRDGVTVAESIDRYLNNKDMKKGRKEKDYEEAETPFRSVYKDQPKIIWKPAKKRLNFEPFEKEYSWEEVIEEATRCLYCGPCLSCKGCVFLEYQDDIPDIEIDEDSCSGCTVCIGLCPYNALSMKEGKDHKVAEIDVLKCKRCGVCVTACPSNAINIKDKIKKEIAAIK